MRLVKRADYVRIPVEVESAVGAANVSVSGQDHPLFRGVRRQFRKALFEKMCRGIPIVDRMVALEEGGDRGQTAGGNLGADVVCHRAGERGGHDASHGGGKDAAKRGADDGDPMQAGRDQNMPDVVEKGARIVSTPVGRAIRSSPTDEIRANDPSRG